MLSEENKMDSFSNVKSFVELQNGRAGSFHSKSYVLVISSSGKYLYHKVRIEISYSCEYMDYSVDIIWEDDENQPPYTDLGLHG